MSHGPSSTYEGLRVLDLGTYIAAPVAAMILGDLGADVIKVERPPRGDETRLLPPFHGDEATLFTAFNRSKRSLVLDYRSGDGREALLRLVDSADVVIESFPPGVGAKLELTFEDLKARNPRVVHGTVSAFGEGPLGSKMPGYDALVQAASGLMSFTGSPDTPTVRMAPSVLDLSTGMWLAMGIMAALARRERDGQAQHVPAALLDTAAMVMGHQLQGYQETGEVPVKLGSGSPSAMPNRVYEGSDGAFMLATASDAQWVRLCAALGLDELAERFPSVDARVAGREEVDAALEARFAAEPVATWLERLPAVGISVGPVNDVREAMEMPVTAERELFVAPETIGWENGMPLLRLPFDAAAEGVRRRPPHLGEHTAEVLREAGYDEDAIAALT